MSESFYCVVHGRGNEWEAICLDLDLSVQGQSNHEVKQQLSRAIDSYVADAMRESQMDRARLLARRAPLRVRLYWAGRIALAALRGRRDADLPVGYPEHCHA